MTLLMASVLLSAGSGIYAYVTLRGLGKRQAGLVRQVEVLNAVGQVRKHFTYLAGLPAKMLAHPGRAPEYAKDLESMSAMVADLLNQYGTEIHKDLGTEWRAYVDKLARLLPQLARGRTQSGAALKALDEVENDEYLQMNMLLDQAVREEQDETGRILETISGANRRILTFLALGLILGLVLAAEAYRESALIRSQNLLVKKMAGTDPLTGLSNRRAFDDAFAKAWESKGPLSVVLFDIDHFKTYNDNYGHPEGDKLLKVLARRLKESCPGNAFLARWGGEEFVLLLPGQGLDQARSLAESFRSLVERLHSTEEEKLARPVTISLGLAQDAERKGRALDLIEKADKALYQAKQGGRNRWMAAAS